MSSDDEKEKKHFQKVVMNFQNYKSVMTNQIGMGAMYFYVDLNNDNVILPPLSPPVG